MEVGGDEAPTALSSARSIGGAASGFGSVLYGAVRSAKEIDCRLGADARKVLRLGDKGFGGERGDAAEAFEDVGAGGGGGGPLGPARAAPPLPLGRLGGGRYPMVGLRVVPGFGMRW